MFFLSREVLRVFDRGLDCSEFFLGNFDRFRPGRAEKHDGIFDFLLREAEAGFRHFAKYTDATSRVAI